MDEPFNALDHQTRGLMQALLHGIRETERKTVLFVTHDIGEAIFMGHRVVMMSAWPCRIECDMPMAIAHLYHCSAKTTAMFMELKAHLTEEIRVEMRQAKALLATDS